MNLFKKKHEWVSFHNPRNKRVRIVACSRCGVAKGQIADKVECIEKAGGTHHMTKMGWELSVIAEGQA